MKKPTRKTVSTSLIILAGIVCVALITYQFNDPVMAGPLEEELPEPVAATKNAAPGYTIKMDDLKLLPVKQSRKSVGSPISGRVVPKNTTQIYSEVQGKIISKGFRLKKGMTFKAGETLAILDEREFGYQLEARRSAFLNILTSIMPDLKADYPDNYVAWLSYVEDYHSGENLAPLPETLSDGEKYFVSSNEVFTNYYDIKALEERLSKFKIIAPYNGSVTVAMADEGGMVVPGQQLGTIINNGSYELEAAAGLDIISDVKIGDRMEFKSNDLPGKWTGTVVRINDVVDTNTQNVSIYFSITGPNLKSGMYLEGAFHNDTYEEVFVLPAGSLSRDSKVLLFEDKTIRSRPVELVEFIQDSILVKGLSDDDLVITNTFDVPVEGLKVAR